MQFETYADREMAAMLLADVLASDLKAALVSQDRATLVVPGGTTPGPVFDALCAADLDWARVNVMLSDERWVPETHERSNTALLRKRLLVNRAAEARFVSFYAEGETPETAAETLRPAITDLLPLSVLLLGMGADMHTASLFPNAPGLSDALRDDAPPLVPVHAAGQEPRISLSGPALSGAVSKHLVIFGAEKREALERARTMAPEYAPVRVVMNDLTVHWAE